VSAEKLYTTEMLSAAMELAQYPVLEHADLHGTARSDNCGSSLDLYIVLDQQERFEQIGMRVHACAVGQAAAAIFARHAKGASSAQLAKVYDEFVAWLGSDAPPPDWPDLSLIAPARAYRGRHGAMLLPWRAASKALSSAPASG